MNEVCVKERPILFSGAMVRALLAGTKTQTRRVVKPQPVIDDTSGYVFDGNHRLMYKNDMLHEPWQKGFARDLCPYGQPGDRLWVRETLYWENCGDDWSYQADNNPVWENRYDGYTAPILLKQKPAIPSIHMPREACRLLLEITAVRCERLQDISEADAVAEGCSPDFWLRLNWKHPVALSGEGHIARENYASLWHEINGRDSWVANPWVWAVEFKVIDGKEPARG